MMPHAQFTLPPAYSVALFALLLVAFTFSAGAASACLGPGSENRLLFERLPDFPPPNDIIAAVTVTTVGSDESEARVESVISGTQLRAGDVVTLHYRRTSCGPNPAVGDRGTIIARQPDAGAGRLQLYPYTHRWEDGKVFAPRLDGTGDVQPRVGAGSARTEAH
jgi:hypothetical protein